MFVVVASENGTNIEFSFRTFIENANFENVILSGMSIPARKSCNTTNETLPNMFCLKACKVNYIVAFLHRIQASEN